MKRRLISNVLGAGLVIALLGAGRVAISGDPEPEWEDDDLAYDRAHRAVERGEALPIAELLERLQTTVPGEVVGIEFAREHGYWIYEFKVVDALGHLREVTVDARTGELLSLEDD